MAPDGDTFENEEATHIWLPDTSRSPPDDPSSSESARPATTRMLGRFELVELLGRGGMGEVYRAVHTRLQKQVAVKILPADRMNDVHAAARFRREIRLVGELSHPNLVRLENAGEADGVHYLVMEYVPGVDLERLVRRLGPLPIAEACQLVGQAAIGLEHARRRGLVHRDIKPSNLMLSSTGAVKILDFGLALLKDSAEELTASNRTVGTIEYLAPEQAKDSGAVDIRADIYSLGCTLFKLLTGRPPFDGEQLSPQQLVLAHVGTPPPSVQLLRADAPDELAEVVSRMLAKDACDRYQTPAEAAAALAPLAAGCEVKGLLAHVDLTALPADALGASSIDTADYLASAATDPGVPETVPPVYELEEPTSSNEHVAGRRTLVVAVIGCAVLTLVATLTFALSGRWRREPGISTPPTIPLTTLSWGEHRWPDPLVLSREFTFDDVTVTIALNDDWYGVSQAPLPHDSQAFHGGLASPEECLVLAGGAGKDFALTATITFSTPVRDVSFELFDVDRESIRPDQVEINGLFESRPVRPVLTAGTANRVAPDSAIVDGVQAAADRGANSGAGNLRVTFPDVVERLELRVSGAAADAGGSTSGVYTIALHDIHFSVNRPFGARHALDWDVLDWRRVRHAAVAAGRVEASFTLSGDGALTGSQDFGLSNSEALTGGAASSRTNLLWSVPARSVHEVTALTIDFSEPVADLTFSLFDIDADPAGGADRMAVFGMRAGRLRSPTVGKIGAAVKYSNASYGAAAAWHPSEYASRLASLSPWPLAPVAIFTGVAPAYDDTDVGNAQVRFAAQVDRVVLVLGKEAPNSPLPPSETSPPQQIAISDLKFRPANEESMGGQGPVRLVVPGFTNPYLAGGQVGANRGRDAAPGESPVEVKGLPITPGTVFTFAATGAVRVSPGVLTCGPQGGSQQIGPDSLPVASLVGVFLRRSQKPLGPTTPRPAAAPASGAVSPNLGELFLIGDGRTPKGESHSYVAPAGAERLYLGVMDAGDWCDNVGAFEVEISVLPSPPGMAAAKTANGASRLDLLALLDPARDVIDGRATVEHGAVTLDADEGQRALAQIPLVPPDGYVLRLTVERRSGIGSFGLGLPLGGETILAVFDHESASGLWRSDGKQRSLGASFDGGLPVGERVVFEITVDAQRVQISHNGEVRLLVPKGAGQFPLHGQDRGFYEGVLFLHSYGSRFVIHELSLVSVSGETRPIVFAVDDPQRQVAEQALWKGGRVRVQMAGAVSDYLDRLEDLPPALELEGIFARDSEQGIAWTDAELTLVRHVRQLRSLNLTRARIGDGGLAHLAELTDLENLVLSHTAVTDAGLAHLQTLTKVRTLFLVGAPVGDPGIAQLRGMTQLNRVGLSSTQVGDSGIAALTPALANAQWLCVCGAKVTSASLPHLAQLQNLRTLHLGGAPIGDDDLPHIYRLANLKELRLAGTNVTEQGQTKLKKNLPNVKLVP